MIKVVVKGSRVYELDGSDEGRLLKTHHKTWLAAREGRVTPALRHLVAAAQGEEISIEVVR